MTEGITSPLSNVDKAWDRGLCQSSVSLFISIASLLNMVVHAKICNIFVIYGLQNTEFLEKMKKEIQAFML